MSENFTSPEVEVKLVNNGSSDDTYLNILEMAKTDRSLFHPLNLDRNYGYGGGVFQAFPMVESDWVCWIPGDLQVRPAEMKSLWEYIKTNDCRDTVVKGKRVSREDSTGNLIVSRLYTLIGRLILGLRTADLNALPKFFPVDFIQTLPDNMESSFVFDAEMLYLAKLNNLPVTELPVGWYKRHSGISSWSGQKLKVYLRTFVRMLAVRHKYCND